MSDAVTNKISVSVDSSLQIKKCWSVGPHVLVVIAEELVRRFGINEDNTYVEQLVTDDGILLRVKHYVKEGKM